MGRTSRYLLSFKFLAIDSNCRTHLSNFSNCHCGIGGGGGCEGAVQREFAAGCSPDSVVAVVGYSMRFSFLVIFNIKQNDKKNMI